MNLSSIYIGTYTAPGGSEGIYRAIFDSTTGKLDQLSLAAKAANPSFLALHPNGRNLYAVHEGPEGGLSAYGIEGGFLKHLNTKPVQGADPCHLVVGDSVYVACYSSGTLTHVSLHHDRSLDSILEIFTNEGSGPNKSRQEKPHMHAAKIHNGKVYVCDLGTDEVLEFGLKSLKTAERRFKVQAGSGPRHIAFHSNGFAYVNSEMTGTVSVFSNHWDLVQTSESGTKGEGTTAEIVIHPNGKWLYVSNRGPNTISVFHIGSDGKLRLASTPSAHVKIPRGMDIDASGKWLIVAGQDSNDVVVLPIHEGKVGDPVSRISVPKPVCVLSARH